MFLDILLRTRKNIPYRMDYRYNTNFWKLFAAFIESNEFDILFLFLGFGSGVRVALVISSVDVASVFTWQERKNQQFVMLTRTKQKSKIHLYETCGLRETPCLSGRIWRYFFVFFSCVLSRRPSPVSPWPRKPRRRRSKSLRDSHRELFPSVTRPDKLYCYAQRISNSEWFRVIIKRPPPVPAKFTEGQMLGNLYHFNAYINTQNRLFFCKRFNFR